MICRARGMKGSSVSLVALAFATLASLAGCGGGGSSSPSPAAPPMSYTPPAPGLYSNRTLAVGAVTRHFDYYVPPGLPEQAPLLVLLHGGGQNKTQVIDGSTGSSGWRDVAEERKFLLLIPNGTDANGDTNAVTASWNDCRSDQVTGSTQDDVAFIAALIDWALQRPEFRLDPARIYVTGVSNGGLMSYRAALQLGHRIAGIAAFIANNPRNLEPDCAAAVALPDPPAVSVMVAVGTQDPLMPFAGGAVAFGNGGQVYSAEETRNFWRARNATTVTGPVVNYPDVDPTDGSTVSAVVDSGGRQGSAVAFLVVAGGGHSMPSPTYVGIGSQNRDVESSRLAWDFLQDKRR